MALASNERQPTVDTDQGFRPPAGPPFTILDVRRSASGGARVLVRIRGGRRVRLYVPVRLVNGPDITDMVAVVVAVETERQTDGRHLPGDHTTSDSRPAT